MKDAAKLLHIDFQQHGKRNWNFTNYGQMVASMSSMSMSTSFSISDPNVSSTSSSMEPSKNVDAGRVEKGPRKKKPKLDSNIDDEESSDSSDDE